MNEASGNSKQTIADVDSLKHLVQSCIDQKKPLVDYGVAHTGLGRRPPENAVHLNQTGTILELYERDLTVRAAAGTTVADLNAQLAEVRQFIPFDADDDMTLGEVINHNVYGPLRTGYNAIRDWLLGLRYLDGECKDIHVGGRTVKNVAGYDVSRLMVGSLGELGVVYEATVRTYATPDQVAAIELTVANPVEFDQLLPQLLLTEAAPAWLQLWRNVDEQRWDVSLAYYGRPRANAIQRRSLETLLDNCTDIHIAGTTESGLDEDIALRAERRAWRRVSPAVAKLVVPPASAGRTVVALESWAELHQPKLHIEAIPAYGCIFTGGNLSSEQLSEFDGMITRTIEESGGFRAWYQRPEATGDDGIEPFSPPQPDWPMLAQLKKTMDPHLLFNPGRLLPIS